MELKDVRKADSEINSKTEESFPLLSPDGRLYFVRSIWEENVGGIRAGQDIWYVEPREDGWSEAKHDVGKLNNIFNNGVVGIADSGRTLFLNSTYSNKLDYQIGLSKSEWKDGSWSNPKRVRMKGFNPRTGFLSFYVDDGKGVMLISFTSSISKNEDLYVSLKDRGKWRKPIRLGPTINTPGAEFSPYLSDDGRVLYFSSNGHPGMGEADIFWSRRLDDTWQSWSEPQPLPEPINSSAFDAYFTLHDTVAYFSSNRDGEFSDIYVATYQKRVQEQRPEVVQEDTAVDAPFVIVGQVRDKKLGKLEEIEVVDEKGEVVQTVEADEDGEFILEDLPNYQRYYIDLNGKLDDPTLSVRTEETDEIDLAKAIDRNRFTFEIGDRRIKEVRDAQVLVASADRSTLFGVGDGETFDSKVKLGLLNRAGKEIENVKLSEDGTFKFEEIRNGELYALDVSDIESLKGRSFYVTKDSQRIQISEFILQGFPFKKLPNGEVILYQEELLSSDMSSKFAFDYDRLDMAGNTIYLYDESGEPISKAVVNKNGFFAFEQLDPEKKYSMGLESEKDLGGNIPQLYGIDKDGERVALAAGILSGEQFQGDPARQEVKVPKKDVFVFEWINVPELGSKFYLVDADGNKVDSAYVNEVGELAYNQLPKEGEFYVQAENVEALDLNFERYFVLDNDPTENELNMQGRTMRPVVGALQVVSTETFTFEGEEKPPAGTVVYVTDENDNIIDSAEVGENGEITFTRLPPDGNFKLKLDKENDTSMGLDRFFIKDATGKEIAFNEEGVTVKRVMGKEQAEKAETFQIGGSEGDGPPAGTVVYATDNEGNVIDSAEVEEDGTITFTRLPADGNFKLKLEKAVDNSMGLDRFFIVDASGDEIAFDEKGETTKKIAGKNQAATTETFVVSTEDDSGPPAGTIVYATDNEGNVIDSAEVEEDGTIKFTRLPPDGNYKLQLQKEIDTSLGLDRFFITDATGDKIAFDKEGKTTKKIAGKQQAETTEIFQVNSDETGGGPPVGTMVYATDLEGNVIDSAEVDESGEIKFTRLPPDGNYKLQLQKEVDNSLGLDRFFVTDASGETVAFNKDGQTETTVVGKSFAKRIDYYKFDYDQLPPKGSMVYLLDENQNIIDSARVGEENKFRFAKLDPEQDYSLEIFNEDGSRFNFDSFSISGRNDASFELKQGVSNQTRFASMSEEELAQKYDRFAFDRSTAPVVGTKVYIYDEAGEVVDSATIYSKGRFNVDRLAAEQSYTIKVADSSYDASNKKLSAWVQGAKRALPYLNGGFNYRPVDEILIAQTKVDAEDTDLQFDQFLLATEESIEGGAKAFLYEDEERIGLTDVDRDGSFQFDALDQEKQYRIAFNDQAHAENATLYALSGGEQRALASTGDGFIVNGQAAGEEGTNISIAESTPRLGSEQDESIGLSDVEYLPFPEEYSSLTAEEREKRFDRFSFDPRYLPEATATVTITDKQGREVATSKIYADGQFYVDRLKRDETYSIKVNDEAFSVEGATLYATTNGDRMKLTRLGETFVFNPVSGSDLVISLAGRDPEGQDTDQKVDKDDFPLTPPKDEKDDYVPVEEDVVNNTVFDDPDKKASTQAEPAKDQKAAAVVEEDDKQPKKAVAVLDESDYKLKSGIAQVMQTERGWNMQFDFNEFLLSEYQIDYIYEVVIPMLKKNPDMKLTIEGHTDDIGSDSVNYRVSILRISNVLYHLEMAGIEDTQINVVPKGETEPIAPNDTEMGRARNRRVELVKPEGYE